MIWIDIHVSQEIASIEPFLSSIIKVKKEGAYALPIFLSYSAGTTSHPYTPGSQWFRVAWKYILCRYELLNLRHYTMLLDSYPKPTIQTRYLCHYYSLRQALQGQLALRVQGLE